MDLGLGGGSPEDNWDFYKKEGIKDGQAITDDSPTPPSTFAISFCWSELNVEIQITRRFLGQGPDDTVSLRSSSWTQCSELPPAE